jgi:hypothetical protein
VRSSHEHVDGAGYPEGRGRAQFRSYAGTQLDRDVVRAVCVGLPDSDSSPWPGGFGWRRTSGVRCETAQELLPETCALWTIPAV